MFISPRDASRQRPSPAAETATSPTSGRGESSATDRQLKTRSPRPAQRGWSEAVSSVRGPFIIMVISPRNASRQRPSPAAETATSPTSGRGESSATDRQLKTRSPRPAQRGWSESASSVRGPFIIMVISPRNASRQRPSPAAETGTSPGGRGESAATDRQLKTQSPRPAQRGRSEAASSARGPFIIMVISPRQRLTAKTLSRG